MAKIVLPDQLTVSSRDDLVARFLADIAFRAPTVAVGQGLTPNIDAVMVADAVLPILGEAVRQGEGIDLDNLSGDALQQEAVDSGLPAQLPAVGATGYGVVSASIGGGNAPTGLIAKHPTTQAKYKVVVGGVYADGDPIQLVSVDTGPQTNLEAGTILQWVSPPIGFNLYVTVQADSNGDGLIGGRDAETDEEIRQRIRDARANPAASGNDAAYQDAARKTPSVPSVAAFTYPAIGGPGTTCVAILVRPSKLGASRIPTAAQLTLVRGNVIGQMPKDDSSAFVVVIEVPTSVIVQLDWAQGNAKWTDNQPWPTYDAGGNFVVQAAPTPTPTSFTVLTAGAQSAPVVGQTIAVFDRANLRFLPKRIVSVSGANPYALTFDSGGGSDTTFVPSTGALISPWSDSLAQLPDLLATYFETLGPGEMKDFLVTPFFDDGYREKRNPPSPQYWPNEITERILVPILELASVEGAKIASPSLPAITPVGVLNTSVNLLTLGDVAVFPKS